MAKKEDVVVNAEEKVNDETFVEQTESKKQAVQVKQDTKTDKKKKAKKPSKTLKFFKETGSELKKVNWPTFRTVVKQTGIVLAVVIIFTVVLFGIDRLLSLLFKLLVSALGTGA